MIRNRPTLYEWISLEDSYVEFQFRVAIDSKTDQGFKLIAIENERSMWLQVNQKQVGVGSNIKF